MKNCIDDSVPLSCNIDASTTTHNVTSYVIRVQRGCASESSWVINKRYSDFVTLATALQQYGADMTLPPKKMFGNLDKEFIAERQTGLQNFLNQLMSETMLMSSLIVKQFLCPQDYSVNFQEEALQHVSMMFRSEAQYELVEPLIDIGGRIRKSYFLLKPSAAAAARSDGGKGKAARYLLSRCQHGPHKHLSVKDLQSLFKMLTSIKHPHVESILYSSVNESGGLVVYKYYDSGTLRDYINKSKVKLAYMKKYYSGVAGGAGGAGVATLSRAQCAVLGRQLLDTLHYLHRKCLYPGGHVHPGNIVVRDGHLHLLDIHNWLLGQPSLYRAHFTQHRRINSVELVDVYSFGHTLYEMCYGRQLNTSTCDHFPTHTDPEIRSVLEAILTTEACKRGLPTISQLLQHSLFSKVSPGPVAANVEDKPVCKVGSKLKEVLNTCRLQYEAELQQEQKQLSQWRRFSKAQAYHMSDEEKRRRKLELRRKSAQEQKLLQQQGSAAVGESKRHSVAGVASASTAAPPAPAAAPHGATSDRPTVSHHTSTDTH